MYVYTVMEGLPSRLFYANLPALHDRFLDAKPFNHLVLDDMFDAENLSDIYNEIREIPEENWIARLNKSAVETENKFFLRKKAFNKLDQMPSKTRQLVEMLCSKEMITFVESVTGIYGLQSDLSLYGGGLHKITEGGRLSVHADFNAHPRLQVQRRVNLILYLNKDWLPDHNGEFELWSPDMNECVKKIPPLFNRLLLFRNTETSFHGHPIPWASADPRYSIAVYYYTTDRPSHELMPFHWTSWQKRYNIDY